jgi:hypothetical protein
METRIKEIWDRLQPSTRKRLTENPGSVVLPRTLVETIAKELEVDLERDQHGQVTLSPDDQEFIRSQS